MRTIMTTAWEIARNAAYKFGGNAKEYIALALKEAWAMKRREEQYNQPFIMNVIANHDKNCYEIELLQGTKVLEVLSGLNKSIYMHNLSFYTQKRGFKTVHAYKVVNGVREFIRTVNY